jgi:uncharacterized protein YjbJ (UPF0337 family)
MASSTDAKTSAETGASAEAGASESRSSGERSEDAGGTGERATPHEHATGTPEQRSEQRAERRMLTATFVNQDNADRALDVVRERDGYSEDDVSSLRSDATREKYFGDDRHEHVEIHMANKVPEGASTGALIGAILGALAGAFGAVEIGNSIAIPALGIALSGTLSSILAGIGTGGTLGGIIGGLIGAVFPEERAVRREGDFERGGLVLGIISHNDEDADYFYEKWDEASGERVYYQDEGAWDLFKAQLLEQYDGALTDNGIDPYMGEREKLIGHIREKTGDSYEEAERNVDQATEREHYNFGAPSGRPRSDRWDVFKRHLLDAYREDGLTEEELDERKGQRERLEGHLQERTGQSQREIEHRINDARERSDYSF